LLGDDTGLAQTLCANRLSSVSLPKPFRLEFGVAVLFWTDKLFVEPLADVLAGLGLKSADDFPIITWDKVADLMLALDDDGERGRLNAADCGFEKAPRF